MKRVVLAVSLFLLAACSGPGQYERGVRPVTPRPPTFQPHQDAPHTRGQPSYRGHPGTTRSPNQRHFQPRRDGQPQMMAADGDNERAIRLLLSEPAPAPYAGISESAHEKCWADVLGLLRTERSIWAMSHQEVRCLRLLTYYHCGARFIDAAETGQPGFLDSFPGRYDSDAFEDAVPGKQAMKLCGGRERNLMTDRVLDAKHELTRKGDDGLSWRTPRAAN